MKNLIKVFAVSAFVVAVMFSANSAEAKSAFQKCMDAWNNEAACREHLAKLDNLQDPAGVENESEVADSGNEGPTSAAQESDQ